MKDRSDDLSYHVQTLLPQSFISLLSNKKNSTYLSLCYTSRRAMAGTRNSSMGAPWRIDLMTHRTMSERSYHGATFHFCPTERIAHISAFVTPVVEQWLEWEIAQWVHHEGSIQRPITPWANHRSTSRSYRTTESGFEKKSSFLLSRLLLSWSDSAL